MARRDGGRVRLGTTPHPQKLPIAPIFIADKVSLAVSREKSATTLRGSETNKRNGWENARNGGSNWGSFAYGTAV